MMKVWIKRRMNTSSVCVILCAICNRQGVSFGDKQEKEEEGKEQEKRSKNERGNNV